LTYKWLILLQWHHATVYIATFYGKSCLEISGKTSAPDEIWTLSQPQQRGDEMKILSGVSQSPRGDELIEIVQYLLIWQLNAHQQNPW